ncbi:MAG: hypothetical protein IPH28_22980 [Cytophagaceae bacterium]|nr:hypothetical protein [Cytophagaceae bacterium]
MKSIVLIVNILASISFLPALYMAIFSPFLFDSGATTRTWTLFFTVLAIPASIIITQIISWILFSRGNYSTALWVSLIPLIFVILLVIMFLSSNKLT